MVRAWGVLIGTAVALATAVASAQGSSGALPPVEEQPPPPTGAQPPEAPPAEPGPPPPATAAPPAQPPPAAQPYPPPGAYPAYPPGYAYPLPPKPEPEPVRNVSLTLSPIHLLLPIFELTAEARVVDHFGLAVLGGFGSVTAENNAGESEKFSAYEVGGQALWYPMKPFHGLHLGAEALYLKIASDDMNDGQVRGTGTGLAVGPLVGYKVLTSGGFTFVAQGGVEYVAIQAEANDKAGNSAQEDESRWIPLLNLNLGFSF